MNSNGDCIQSVFLGSQKVLYVQNKCSNQSNYIDHVPFVGSVTRLTQAGLFALKSLAFCHDICALTLPFFACCACAKRLKVCAGL